MKKNFNQEEIQMLYNATMDHAKKIDDSRKELSMDMDISQVLEAKSKKYYDLAVKLTGFMDED